MRLTGTFSIGPFSIPEFAAAVILVLLVSYLAGLYGLKKDRDSRKAYSDIFLTPLLPFILGWKLSLFITDAADVFKNPLIILYATGGIFNILIGLIPAGFFTALRWRREPRRNAVLKGIIPAALTGLILSGLSVLIPPPADIRERQQLTPVYVTDDDNELTNLRNGDGKPVIINFWASWCPPCRAEMPMLESAMADIRFSGAVFYMVNASVTEKSPDQGRKWLEDNDIDMPLFFDTTGSAMADFGVEVLPTTIILDSRGYPVVRKTGAVSRSWLLAGLRKAGRSD